MTFSTSLSKALDIVKLKANETSDSEYRNDKNNIMFAFVKKQEDFSLRDSSVPHGK